MSSPIRVLHMIAVLEMGGSQSMVMNLYRAIDRNKVQFDFIVDHPDRDVELRKEIESLGGRIYTFPTFKGKNIVEIIRTWERFFSDHPEYKILHTHSRSYASIYLPIAKRYGLVTIAHSHSTSNGSGVPAKVKDLMQLPIRYQADYMFACSKEAGEWLFGKKKVNSKRFKVIPNSIDSKKYIYNPTTREKIRRELGLSDSFVLGHVGRMTIPKNHLFLLRVFAEVKKQTKNLKLLLVGDGELMEEVKAEVEMLEISESVLFAGSKANVQDYYQAMDCFVFPSLWEGLGIAVIEAQASGLPCIVSESLPKKVDIGAGLVSFKSINAPVSEWVEAIKKCNKKRNDQSEYVSKAGYDIENNTDYLQTFYERLYQ